MEKKQKLILFFVVLFIALCMTEVFATGVEAMPWDSGLDKIYKALTGRTVMIIGGIMIVGAAVTLMFAGGGALSKIMWIVVGLGIAINAPNFVNMLTGNAATAAGFLIR